MARRRRAGIKVLFTGRPELAPNAAGIGGSETPISVADVVNAAIRLLQPADSGSKSRSRQQFICRRTQRLPSVLTPMAEQSPLSEVAALRQQAERVRHASCWVGTRRRELV